MWFKSTAGFRNWCCRGLPCTAHPTPTFVFYGSPDQDSVCHCLLHEICKTYGFYIQIKGNVYEVTRKSAGTGNVWLVHGRCNRPGSPEKKKKVRVQQYEYRSAPISQTFWQMASHADERKNRRLSGKMLKYRMHGILVTGLAHYTSCALGGPALTKAMSLLRVYEPEQSVFSMLLRTL